MQFTFLRTFYRTSRHIFYRTGKRLTVFSDIPFTVSPGISLKYLQASLRNTFHSFRGTPFTISSGIPFTMHFCISLAYLLENLPAYFYSISRHNFYSAFLHLPRIPFRVSPGIPFMVLPGSSPAYHLQYSPTYLKYFESASLLAMRKVQNVVVF